MGIAEKQSNFLSLLNRRPGDEAQPPSLTEQEDAKRTEDAKRAAKNQRRSEKAGKEFQLTSADEQTTELLKTANHVMTQVQETQRLRAFKEAMLEPSDCTWMDSTIEDAAAAVTDVTILLEPFRIEKQTNNGKLSLATQFRWMYRDNQRAQVKKNHLSICHNSLMPVLYHLKRLKAPVPVPVSGPPTIFELDSQVTLGEETRDHLHSYRSPPSLYHENGVDTNRTIIRKGSSNEMADLLAWRHLKGAPVVATSCTQSDTSSSIG